MVKNRLRLRVTEYDSPHPHPPARPLQFLPGLLSRVGLTFHPFVDFRLIVQCVPMHTLSALRAAFFKCEPQSIETRVRSQIIRVLEGISNQGPTTDEIASRSVALRVSAHLILSGVVTVRLEITAAHQQYPLCCR